MNLINNVSNFNLRYSYEMEEKFKGFEVDESTVRAKFSKKAGTLTLTIDKI